uniref:Uncharacterized protein n=1 Tax=Ditylum brightwellii TaxID=49249 RepID=A0A7S2E8S0_9STRA|mmetsp:Transcript_19124/g.28570  ORF Transcript_19124/g.28570 Transcript_19124/m.28570 type:complete len:214 (+) Transcript_19124:12-653(+)
MMPKRDFFVWSTIIVLLLVDASNAAFLSNHRQQGTIVLVRPLQQIMGQKLVVPYDKVEQSRHHSCRLPKHTITPRFSKKNDDSSSSTTTTTTTIYNDDCFGLTSFVAGIGTGDIPFAIVFVTLTAIAALLTQQKLLPPDWKNPEIVDRKVPGVIAALTLLFTPAVTDALVKSGVLDDVSPSMDVDPIGKYVQIGICSFSMITAFLDIRWRDNL